jgi:hypothetical protein
MREIQAPAAEPLWLGEFRDTLRRHASRLTDAVSNHCAWTWHLSTQPPFETARIALSTLYKYIRPNGELTEDGLKLVGSR